MKLPWPELPSTHRPDETIREILDYLCWVSREMLGAGYGTRSDLPYWRVRVQEAYRALFTPPVPNHGDPYPPDVPPARTPGVWPDIPSAGVPGMTLRHQLKVINIRALELRKMVWVHARQGEVAEWDRRLSRARASLDQGAGLPMPEAARTQPSPAVLAEAQAQEDAIKEHARKRALRLQRLKASAQRKASAKKKAKAVGKRTAGKKKAAAKKATPKKKVAARKRAPAKKKASRGKAKAAAKKATPKKKAAASKRAPAKMKAPPRKTTAAKQKTAASRKRKAVAKKPAAKKKNRNTARKGGGAG